MWMVNRYGVNKTWNLWCYCTNCIHSAEEVLHEIDTDECSFGIAGIDDFLNFPEKDYTRLRESRDRAFAKLG